MRLRPVFHVRGDLLLIHATANDLTNHFTQSLPVPQPERIGLAERLPDGGITRGGALIGPDKVNLQQLGAVQLVNAERGIGVSRPRNVLEGQRGEIVA